MADRYGSLFGPGSQPGYGPWEDMSPVLQRRRKPDGTYEHRPRPMAGGLEAVTPVETPDTSLGAIVKGALGVTGTTAADAMVGTARLPGQALGAVQATVKRGASSLDPRSREKKDAYAKLFAGGLAAPLPDRFDPLKGAAETSGAAAQGAREKLAEATQDLPTPAAVSINQVATMTGLALDASQYVGLGAGRYAQLDEAAQRALARSGKASGRASLDPVPIDMHYYGKPAGYLPTVWLRGKNKTAARMPEREGIPIIIEGTADPDLRKTIIGRWDQVSRRHPRIAGSVEAIVVDPKRERLGKLSAAHFDPIRREVVIDPRVADKPEVWFHELTHAGQRGDAEFSQFALDGSLVENHRKIVRNEQPAFDRGRAYGRLEKPNADALVDPMSLSDEALEQRLRSLEALLEDPAIGPHRLDGLRLIREDEVLRHEWRRRVKEATDASSGSWSDAWGAAVARQEVAGFGGDAPLAELYRETQDIGEAASRPRPPAPSTDAMQHAGSDAPSDLAELARRSLSLAPSPPAAGRRTVADFLDMDATGSSSRTLTALSESGDEIGELRYTRHAGGGFTVDSVTTGERGSGVGRQLYREAFRREGPYRGSLAQTPEGEGFVARLRETDPEIFEGAPPAPGRQGGGVTPSPNSAGSQVSPPFSGVYDDPMQAVLGPEVAREYRQLEETLRAATRERLAGRPGRLLPHQEDAIDARMAEIQGSVTPEQWGFAVSGQGDIPPLPAGRVFAQEPQITSSLGSYERLFPTDNGGLRSVMDDLTPANDAGRARPQLAPPGPEAQGGGVASGAAESRVDQDPGTGTSPPFNPESGAVSAEPLVRGVRSLQRNLLSAGPYKAAAGEFPEAAQRAFVGETIPRRLEAARGSHALAMDELRGRVKQVERAAKAAKRRGEDISGIWDRISQARHGEIPWESLPEVVREPARRMWEQLDELSDARVAEGIVDPEDALDAYTHRAYRAFDDPEWARKVETDPAYRETWDDALALVKRQVPDLADDEAVGVIQALVTRYGPRKMAAAVGAPKAANRVLNKRTLQSPEIRRVMGEYTDARVVAEKTVKEMSWDLEAYEFWRDIGDEGSALGVFRPAGSPTRDVIHRIGGGGEGEMASRFPSEDLLTREGLKQALTGSFEDVRSTWYSRLAGRVNLGKTVGSVATQARNFLGHPMTTIANGRTFWDAGRHRQVVRILARRDLPRRRQAVRLGVLGQGATANEVGDFIRMVDPSGPVSQGLAATGEAFKGAYAGSDDLWRTYNWLGETEDLMHARGLSRPEAEVLAADRVRDTVQTYDRAPKIAEKLRRAPFVGGLGATFYTETIRNVGNIARISADDIAYGMRQLRAGDVVHGRRSIALGMRRYTGLATALVSGAAVAEIQKERHGISDEEEAAARRGLPRYDQNAELIFTGKDEAGLTAWDYSYLNPYSVLSRPIIATQRSIEEGRAPVDAVYELMSALAGGDILATSAAEATFGREIQLWPPELGRPIDDRLAHLGRNIAPGTLNTAEQIASGRRGPEALLGVRTIKIDPEKGTRRQAGSLGAAYDRAASTFRRAGAKDPEKAVAQYLDSVDKLWKESRRLGKDTTTLGLDPSEAQGQLYALPREVRGTLSGAIRNEAGESGSVARPEGWDVPPLPNFRPKDAKEAELYRLLVARFKARYGIN